MVHIRQPIPENESGDIDIHAWIDRLSIDSSHRSLIEQSINLAKLLGEDRPARFGSNCFLQGLELAEMLTEMKMDAESIATAIIYTTAKATDLSVEDIAEQISPSVSKLVEGVLKLGLLNLSHKKLQEQSSQQIDNVRKMILAMVQDVRVVVIKLAERLSLMRALKNFSPEFRQHISTETMEIFAPLANRLGLHHLKWELEDLAFFNLERNTYLSIAKNLDEKRLAREQRVNKIVSQLQSVLKEHGIHAIIYGRAKHIYSIRRKMARKNVDFDQIYDAIAVRVLVDTVEQCYQSLGLAHEIWNPIPEEFDDYISRPKMNGYQSIHTAVMDDDSKFFEIQVRTHAMHEFAEMGVAAHWIYKEGAKQASSAYEEKISWLRQLLAWQQELISDPSKPDEMITDDRVYVFTPADDIIDLPIGSTPLDFAYHIHTQIGHRCRGAKINGTIVPLTEPLKTGDKIEILTSARGTPSRDWLSNKHGYLKTAKARSKVLQWFKNHDTEYQIKQGKELLEKEFARLHLDDVNYQQVASHFNLDSPDALFLGITRGNVKLANVLDFLKIESDIKATPAFALAQSHHLESGGQGISIEGEHNLLTRVARCCKPLPGDSIIGYITQSSGISIHHINCNNIRYAKSHQPKRLLEVAWEAMPKERFAVDIEIAAQNRENLMRDISNAIANEKINITNIAGHLNLKQNLFVVRTTIEIPNLNALEMMMTKLQQIPDVTHVARIRK